MTERKMEPWMLRDLAAVFDSAVPCVTGHAYGALSIMRAICNSEAARREAEAAKPDCSIEACAARNVEHGGCERCPTPTGCASESHCDRHDRPWPKTWSERYKDKELGRAHAETATVAAAVRPQGEREGPDSAAAPNAWRRWCNRKFDACEAAECREGGCALDKPAPAAGDDLVARINAACVGWPTANIPWPHRILHECRDRIEAQARDLEGIYKALAAHGVRVPEIHNAADGIAAMRRALDEQMARVRELEAELAAERDSRQIAQATCDMQKARADGLAAGVRVAKTQIEYQRGATTPQAAQHWTEVVLRTLNAALTEGGA